jgi:hypothetical protein
LRSSWSGFIETLFDKVGLVGDTAGVAAAAVKTREDCAFGDATFDAPLLLHFLTKSHKRTTTETEGEGEEAIENTVRAANVVCGIHVGNARATTGETAIAAILCAPVISHEKGEKKRRRISLEKEEDTGFCWPGFTVRDLLAGSLSVFHHGNVWILFL